MSQVRVQISKKNFAKGLKSAKRLHGTYEPATQTWLIPASMAEFMGPQNPGLIVVQTAEVEPIITLTRCPYYVIEQGCPIHGECCAAGR